jgi:ABC-type multidrug transport system ATPase subunit
LNKQKKIVLNNINLYIKPGELVGLLGVNGAGKTTLASIISSLHPATVGDVKFKGQSIYQDLTGYRLKLGYCPQVPNFENNLSVQENLLFAGRYYGMNHEQITERAASLMHDFELEQYADVSPDKLSGGYQRRLLIARTIIHNPELVILDEPTVGLDPYMRRELLRAIKLLKKDNIAVLLTTHYLDEVEGLVDRVYIIDHGVVVAHGTIAELNAQHGTSKLEDLFFAVTARKINVSDNDVSSDSMANTSNTTEVL